MSDLTGKDSKLGTLLKAASALSKAKDVFDEVKNMAPTVHQHLSGSKFGTTFPILYSIYLSGCFSGDYFLDI